MIYVFSFHVHVQQPLYFCYVAICQGKSVVSKAELGESIRNNMREQIDRKF